MSLQETPTFDINLLNLPLNVLEYICQLLIDNSTWLAIVPKKTDFARFRDVLSLRASCTFFNDVISGMMLYLPCGLSYLCWKNSGDNKKLIHLTNFMKAETNWHFRSLSVQDFDLLAEYDIMSFF